MGVLAAFGIAGGRSTLMSNCHQLRTGDHIMMPAQAQRWHKLSFAHAYRSCWRSPKDGGHARLYRRRRWHRRSCNSMVSAESGPSRHRFRATSPGCLVQGTRARVSPAASTDVPRLTVSRGRSVYPDHDANPQRLGHWRQALQNINPYHADDIS